MSSFPVQMKKGRSGIRLSIIARSSVLGSLAEMVLRETTTFGEVPAGVSEDPERREEVHQRPSVL
jgi:uncharacterized protein (DUF111 family)